MTNATKDKFCRYYRTIVKKRNRDKANRKKIVHFALTIVVPKNNILYIVTRE